MKVSDFTRITEQQLANGNTAHACSRLLVFLENNNDTLYQQVILLSGQYRDIQRNKSLGLENDIQGLNRINNTLIQICAEIKKDYNNQEIEFATQKQLDKVLQEFRNIDKPQHSVKVPKKSNSGLYLLFLGLIVAGLLVWQFVLTSAVSPNDNQTKELQPKIEDSPTQNNSLSRLNSGDTVNMNQKPIFINSKINTQNIEIFETRYYPTNGWSSLVFNGKYYCPLGSSGGCFFSNKSFTLIVDGQTIDTKSENLTIESPDGINNFVVRGNAHQKFQLYYDIPATAKTINLQIKIEGNTTVPIDLTKKIEPIADKHKIINLVNELDLHIPRNFGNGVELVSVKAAPLDDNFFQLTVRLAKNPEGSDYYNECVRVVTDQGKTLIAFDGTKTKVISDRKDRVESQFEFIVPRTVQSPELMVGNCDKDQTPFKIPLKL